MAKRKIWEGKRGADLYRVYWDSEWQEAVGRFYPNGKLRAAADYFDDKQGAIDNGTAQGFVSVKGSPSKRGKTMTARKNPIKKIGAGDRYAVVVQNTTGGTVEGYLGGWNSKGAVFVSTTAEALKTDNKTAMILGSAAYYFIVMEKLDKRYKIGVVNLGK